jgi:cysteine synthase A
VIFERAIMKIYNGIEELVGNTKLVYLKNYCESIGINAKICLKLEASNPAGSVKDRAALYMILDAESKGLIKKALRSSSRQAAIRE